jgi:hypothetical protein
MGYSGDFTKNVINRCSSQKMPSMQAHVKHNINTMHPTPKQTYHIMTASRIELKFLNKYYRKTDISIQKLMQKLC